MSHLLVVVLVVARLTAEHEAGSMPVRGIDPHEVDSAMVTVGVIPMLAGRFFAGHSTYGLS